MTPLAARLVGPSARASARLAASVVLALVIGGAVSAFASWQLALLLGWDGFAAFWLVGSWLIILRSDSDTTAAVATREDDSRERAGLILLLAAIASLLAVGVGLVKANQTSGTAEIVLTVAAITAIVSAWLVVSTHFTLHYARLYYDGNDGGIDFNSSEAPDYRDFAYLALTVGMTYQVSDTDIQARAIRRSITRHALISYLMGTGIIAATINIVAGFVG